MSLWTALFGPFEEPKPHVFYHAWRLYWRCGNGHFVDRGYDIGPEPIVCPKCGCSHFKCVTARLVATNPDGDVSNWVNKVYSYEEFKGCTHEKIEA